MKKFAILVCLLAVSFLAVKAQPSRPTRPTAPTTTQDKPRPSRGDMMAGIDAVERLIDEPYLLTEGQLNVTGDDVTKREAFDAAIAKGDEIIKKYDDEVRAFLASNPHGSLYQHKLKLVQNRGTGANGVITQTEKEFKNGNSLGSVYYLHSLFLYRGFIQSVSRIYADDPVLTEQLKKVNDAIDTYGSREKFMDKMVANQKNQAKNMRMIPAAMSNPKIEALVKAKYEAAFPGFKVTKVNITYATWIIDKNDLGIPLRRKLSVSVGGKNSNGECGIGSSNVGEDYEGGGRYGQAYNYLPSDPIIVPCENIN